MPSNNTPASCSFTGSKFWLAAGIILFGLVMILPLGIPAWFDGLPWAGKVETLSIVVVIPFLLILGYRFLSLCLPIVFLLTLLALKIVMYLGAPSGGWLVKTYPNLTEEHLVFFTGPVDGKFPYPANSRPHMPTEFGELHHQDNRPDYEDGWIRTFATSWNQNASGVLHAPWTKKLEFPVDWVIPSSDEIFDNLSPIHEIEGILLHPEGKRFALVAKGVKEGTLTATDEEGKNFILSPASSFEEASQSQFQLPVGARSWRISGKLQYAGTDWSLIPVWVAEDGTVSSDIGRDALWQDESVLSKSSLALQFYKYLSWVIDGAICLFIFVWGIWTGRSLAQRQALSLPLFTFGAIAMLFPFATGPLIVHALKLVNLRDPTTCSHLGVSVILVAAGFLYWSHVKKDYREFHTDRIVLFIFLLFGPAMLVFFSMRWFPDMGNWWLWGNWDDWVSYQIYSRKIIIRGEWLSGGESAIMGHDLYPYFVAILHGLFGQSPFAQHMADVWFVLGATIILASLAIGLRLPPHMAFITSATYLTINLLGAFRYHIGKSLAENTAMFFMMLAAWYMFRAREGGSGRIVLATIFGILGFWGRQDHVGVILALAFLSAEPIEGPTGGWQGYWDRFKLRWQGIAWYWAGGFVFGVLALCLKNWFWGAGFVLFDSTLRTLNRSFSLVGKFFYLILTGNNWPVFPSIAGFVVTSGTFVALLALVWRPKALVNFPLGLGLMVFCLLAPYSLAGNQGYAPRFSIHLLPLALLSLMICLTPLISHLIEKRTKAV